ncbi:YkgJ family cysteine cluster protein [Ferruginibacter yonginensis]|uniref:YkgJ family cysteine cluster protein n=1 Tax=Ferruginibacter yonginensis TaxID=1310416 RepID=A0ABV8QUR4_9BACT
MLAVNLRSFKRKLAIHRKTYRSFLNKMEKTPAPKIDQLTPIVAAEVWQQVDCTSCANCCKKMTPTFTAKDLKRIAAHFNQTVDAFKEQWLLKDKNNDWVNVKQPCQFLNKQTNMCSIYEVRPADCAGFPHLSKKKFEEYAHVHKQNLDYCPATFLMVQKLKDRVATLTLHK